MYSPDPAHAARGSRPGPGRTAPVPAAGPRHAPVGAGRRGRPHRGEPVSGQRTLEGGQHRPPAAAVQHTRDRSSGRRSRPDRWPAGRRRGPSAPGGRGIGAQRRAVRSGCGRHGAAVPAGDTRRMAADPSSTRPADRGRQLTTASGLPEPLDARPRGHLRARPTAPRHLRRRRQERLRDRHRRGRRRLPPGRAVPLPDRPAVLGVPDGRPGRRAIRHRSRSWPGRNCSRRPGSPRATWRRLGPHCTRPAASARRASTSSTPPT